MTVRIATRRSALALAQSRRVAADLARVTGQPVELVEVTTRGDTDAAPLSQIGGTGVFVTGIRQAVQLLAARRGSLHAAHHEVMECLGEMVWASQRSGRAPDGQAYLDAVRARATR